MIKNKQKWTMLATVTGLLALNFWAWSLLSPLAPLYAKELALSPFKLSALLAVPVIIGSFGRIPLGMLTDKYGGKLMFSVVSIIAAAPVLGLIFANSYSTLLIAALCIGISGASFAIGAPFVNAWFPIKQRGFALGLYAMGNAGTAISGFITPRLTASVNREAVFILVATLLVLAGISMGIWGRNAPTWRPAKKSMIKQLSAALQWKYTWRLSVMYAVTFGAFVSFGLYLPTILNSVYRLSLIDAAARAAGFVLVATLARPIGGWLSDKIGGAAILRVVFAVLTVLACFVAFNPSLVPLGTVIYLSLAVTLGIGNGAVFGFLGHRCDGKIVGSVTGVVGTAGGLGGFFPPLLMGASYQLFHSYGAALYLLAAVCLVMFISIGKLFGKSGYTGQ